MDQTPKTDEEIIEKRETEKYSDKNIYYCFNCRDSFRSKLEFKDAVCIKCGSSKIDNWQNEIST